MFKLTVTPEIARLRDGAGSRNVRVGGKDGLLLTISNRHPVYVATVPPEVEADEQIVKTEVDEAAMLAAGGVLTALPGDEVTPPSAPPEAPAESAEPAVEPAEKPIVQDTVVIEDPKTDPDKVNKSNIPPRKAPKKPASRKGRR